MATNKRQFTKRSIAKQIEFLVEECIKDYEKIHGKIDL